MAPPFVRPSVRALWDAAAEDLRALGAEIVKVDLPVVSNYEEDRPGACGLPARGLVPPDWRALEGGVMTALALDSFLRENGDPRLRSWADVDGDTVFPVENAPVPVWVTRARGGFDWQRLAELVKQGLPDSIDAIPGIEHLLEGLERARRIDFEDWLVSQNLDLIAFPAAGDVGREDLFERAESLEHASRDGVVYSNGNRVLRHLGIPTVTVPMGFMADTQMPVGLTFAGAAYSDDALLDYAWAYEQATNRRQAAFLTPTLPSNQIEADATGAEGNANVRSVTVARRDRSWEIEVRLDSHSARVWADGHVLRREEDEPALFRGRISLARRRLTPEIMVVVRDSRTAATLQMIPLPVECSGTSSTAASSSPSP